MNGTGRDDGARGRWLVLGIVVLALVLGLVALRFRKFAPKPAPVPTLPATGTTR